MTAPTTQTEAKHFSGADIDARFTESFDELLDWLTERQHVRLVKVQDEATVEASRQGRAIVSKPMVSVSASALDKSGPSGRPELLVWLVKRPASGSVTLHVGTGEGSHNDLSIVRLRQWVVDRLQAEGFTVATGKWTPVSAARALSPAPSA